MTTFVHLVLSADTLRSSLVEPALAQAGCAAWPAGDDPEADWQALLLADVVVFDAAITDPEPWFRLGARQALRAGGVVMLQARWKDGLPDPAHLDHDRERLVEQLRDAMAPAATSPIHRRLPHLHEPEWRALLPASGAVAAPVRHWLQHFDTVRRRGLPGDMLVLADEAPIRALQVEARRASARRLLALGHPAFAQEQLDAAAALDPGGRIAAPEDDTVPPPAPAFEPRQVLLFSGHMVDAPGRKEPRFPPHQVPRAQAAIEQALASLGAGPGDLALTQGAAGGDLLFAQACLARGVRLQLLQPIEEERFVAESVLKSSEGEAWHARYLAVRAQLAEPLRSAPAELGAPPPGVDVWERGNLWLLYTALAHGFDRLRCVLLWNGGGGDGPGGTRHMREAVERRAGHVTWLDTRTLFAR